LVSYHTNGSMVFSTYSTNTLIHVLAEIGLKVSPICDPTQNVAGSYRDPIELSPSSQQHHSHLSHPQPPHSLTLCLSLPALQWLSGETSPWRERGLNGRAITPWLRASCGARGMNSGIRRPPSRGARKSGMRCVRLPARLRAAITCWHRPSWTEPASPCLTVTHTLILTRACVCSHVCVWNNTVVVKLFVLMYSMYIFFSQVPR